MEGPRFVLHPQDDLYPKALLETHHVPKHLYVIGDPGVLTDCLAIVGARKASTYGLSVAYRFARICASKGICVVSGGAIGCDSAALKGVVDAGGVGVAVLGGGCNHVYPGHNVSLFNRLIQSGGAVVSEHPWDIKPQPWMFRARNRIIAALGKATLIVEAGLPSGTFSTADEALSMSRDVLVIPGAIDSEYSKGCNRLIYQGAIPVIDDEVFEYELNRLFNR
ncbi:MAG: DNA-processing protein DprA [Eggerthellaceae bacterium]|nr:DNA-processing protein DprA [Eggerthellaceae bacterium]